MICTLLFLLAVVLPANSGVSYWCLLKKVNEMNFKLVLPRPISMPVAAPHGPSLLK